MLLGKSRGQLLIAPEKMQWLRQSENDAHLWMCLVVKVKPDAIKNTIAFQVRFMNVRFMNHSKLHVVKWEKTRLNTNLLGISELKWTGMGELKSDDGEESACNVGDLGSIPGLGRFPGGRHGNPLQYSCLENPMDRGAWWATDHGVARSWTRLYN